MYMLKKQNFYFFFQTADVWTIAEVYGCDPRLACFVKKQKKKKNT